MATGKVVVRSQEGFRNEVSSGSHRFLMDEPQSAGGTDTGPTPYDLLAGALGGCTSMTLFYYAKREGLPLEGVEVSIGHDRQHAKDCADCTSSTGYIHRFQLELRLSGPLTKEQKEHLLSVAKRCPVGKTLMSEIRIDEVLVD